ncbi:MAG: response regulator [Anaerolineae bacterium]|jgi:DNA-binding response OmpR family regulator|nr:response regulator [Anaerolineae bacterium]
MSKTILIVDDDELLSTLTAKALERGGYAVVVARDGLTGIEKFRSEKPDLIVLDVAMPEMSGFEVAKRIRTLEYEENLSHTPIVLLTAYARSFFPSVGREAGVDSYLTKPVTPEQLLEHVSQFLRDNPANTTD